MTSLLHRLARPIAPRVRGSRLPTRLDITLSRPPRPRPRPRPRPACRRTSSFLSLSPHTSLVDIIPCDSQRPLHIDHLPLRPCAALVPTSPPSARRAAPACHPHRRRAFRPRWPRRLVPPDPTAPTSLVTCPPRLTTLFHVSSRATIHHHHHNIVLSASHQQHRRDRQHNTPAAHHGPLRRTRRLHARPPQAQPPLRAIVRRHACDDPNIPLPPCRPTGPRPFRASEWVVCCPASGRRRCE